jgi:hypothetical protein
LSYDYIFDGQIGPFSNVDSVTLSQFSLFNLFSLSETFDTRTQTRDFLTKNLFVSPNYPLVVKTNGSYFEYVSIVPDKNLINSYAFISEEIPVKLYGSVQSLSLFSNIKKSDISQVILYSKIEKNVHEKKDIVAYSYSPLEREWQIINGEVYQEDDVYFYYKFYTNELTSYAIKFNSKLA